ncbi:MAG: hypothetical protein J6B81_03285 [Spirochaetaceae bacterium]|nr:hypothetical protein [Spirochaetaceae bacterium]
MKTLTKQSLSLQQNQEIEEICSIIKNGYSFGLSWHNQLSPTEHFEFVQKLKQVCDIAEWMTYYVKPS